MQTFPLVYSTFSSLVSTLIFTPHSSSTHGFFSRLGGGILFAPSRVSRAEERTGAGGSGQAHSPRNQTAIRHRHPSGPPNPNSNHTVLQKRPINGREGSG